MSPDERRIKTAMARLNWTVNVWGAIIIILLAAALVLVKN